MHLRSTFISSASTRINKGWWLCSASTGEGDSTLLSSLIVSHSMNLSCPSLSAGNKHLRFSNSSKDWGKLILLVKSKLETAVFRLYNFMAKAMPKCGTYAVVGCSVEMDSQSWNTQKWSHRRIVRLCLHKLPWQKLAYLLTFTRVWRKLPSFCSTITRPATLKSRSNQVCLDRSELIRPCAFVSYLHMSLPDSSAV